MTVSTPSSAQPQILCNSLICVQFLDSLQRFLLASVSIFFRSTAGTTAGLFVTFQELILTLHRFWADQGCVIHQPYDVEMGAGTFHPATFLRSLGPEPWRSAYV